MPYTPVTIANCRRASIRRTPWIPMRRKEIVGIRDGPLDKSNTAELGESIDVDLDDICYDWTGRKFYKVRNPVGWIYEGCIDIGGDSDGH